MWDYNCAKLGSCSGQQAEQTRQAVENTVKNAPAIVEGALIAADVVAGGPTGEGIAPAMAMRGMREADKIGPGIKAIGEWGENRAAAEIAAEGGEILARKEPLNTGSVGDIIYRDRKGDVVCCEVKAGKTADTARLSERQQATKDAVASGETVTTRDGTKIDRHEERRYPR